MGGFAQHYSCSLLEGMADDNSIETSIFAALKRVNLIDDITKCRYHRCGRTDAGVSAFNQVISLYLRSNLRSGVEFADEYDPTIIYNPPEEKLQTKPAVEFDYPAVVLAHHINYRFSIRFFLRIFGLLDGVQWIVISALVSHVVVDILRDVDV